MTTSTGHSRALQVPAVAGLSLWTIFGGVSLIGGLVVTGWHFRTGLTLALGGILMAILAQIFGQSWFPAFALIAGAGFLYWGYRDRTLSAPTYRRMKQALVILLQDRPVWIGAFGTIGTVMLESTHLVVGIGASAPSLTSLFGSGKN